MIKRKVSFAMLACLMVVMIVLMAVPMAASAATGVQSVQWSGQAFSGDDSGFYGAGDIEAFKAGSTARLTALVKNEEAADMTIKEAKVTFDWGGVFNATTAPTELAKNETGVFIFEFTVPEVAVATNTTMHRYEVVIGYQLQGTNYVDNFQAFEAGVLSAGTTYQFGHTNMVPGSIRVWFRDSAPSPDTITEQTTGWVANERLGQITFGAAVPGTVTPYAEYRYAEAPFSGTVDGTNTVFYTTHYPLIDGTLKVYLRTDATEKYEAATVSAVDLETGKFTLAAAPTTIQQVLLSDEYWVKMTATASATGTNFVVYSADQADAKALLQTFNSMNTNYPLYLFTPGTAAAKAAEEARVAKAKADAEYGNGDFTGAKADYQVAIDSLQSAINSDNTLNTSLETTLTQMLSGADGVVNAYAAKLNAEAKTAKGQASMYKNVGVFTILLGVATLLAGLGGILWAYSRLVAARGPRQQT